MSLPDLGVGLVHLPGLGPLLGELTFEVDVIEIEPQAFWSHVDDSGFQINRTMLEQAAGDGHVLIHSVGYPVGGRIDGDYRQIAALRETFACLKPLWWSDHASFVWAGSENEKQHLGFLMPPVQSAESVAVISDRIKRLQDLFGLPFAFETGVNYLQPFGGELPDGAFWGAIADRAECGILLDLHNVWTNAANGREPLDKIIPELPLERIWEIHMAGGQSHNGYWLDSHSGMPPANLMNVAADVVPSLPNLHAIVLEIIPDYLPESKVSSADVSECLSALRRIWNGRGGQVLEQPAHRRSKDCPLGDEAPSMPDWEHSVEQALRPAGAEGPLKSDAGVNVYRDLISMARRGMIVEALPLSLRYLLQACGEAGTDSLFRRFWERSPVQPFISDEALAFSEFVRVEVLLPHLEEVLEFELAAHRAAITGRSLVVPFSCEPEPLFQSLMTGSVPPEIRPCLVHVEVTPPS